MKVEVDGSCFGGKGVHLDRAAVRGGLRSSFLRWIEVGSQVDALPVPPLLLLLDPVSSMDELVGDEIEDIVDTCKNRT